MSKAGSTIALGMNPSPLQRKHTPLARRYPTFPEPLHFVQVLGAEIIVMRLALDMREQ